jgi:signal peptidase I
MAKKINKPARPAKATPTPAEPRSPLASVLTWMFGPASKDNMVEWVKIILFAVAVALLIRWPLIEPFKIPSGSMEPTLLGDPGLGRGDRVFVNKWLYGVRYPFMNKRIWYGQDPERWDIVVFKNPEPNASHGTLVKRIVALPGERVHVDPDGQVSINDERLVAPPGVDIRYSNDRVQRPDARYGVLSADAYSIVPDGHYLVLGDNRGNSRDGRFFGWLPNENILGRVACIWFPPTRWRDFTGFTGTWWWMTLVTLLGLWAILRLFFLRSVHVKDGIDTVVKPGDRVVVNHSAFGMRLPFTDLRISRGREARRGEVVVYRAPVSTEPELFLGRVAGLPGDKVRLDGGRLTVNGEEFAAVEDGAAAERSWNVPEGHYFIFAGNGAACDDSRTLGHVSRGHVVGPVSAVWWPRMRRLEHTRS